MAKCDLCGAHEDLPYNCRRCGGTYCVEHRLPENHDCPGLEDWGDPSGVFDSGFDDSVRHRGGRSTSTPEAVLERVGLDTGVGGPFGYFRNNMTYVFLAAMWLWFAIQWAIAPFLLGISPGSRLWYDLFTINTVHPLYVWTWLTSVFSHGGFGHIAINSIVLYFFGPVVERRIGTKKFAALFVLSGMAAGLAQVGATLLSGGGFSAVLGASGSIAALMGVLTILNPNLRIYLYFIIPMPLWIATLLFAGYSVFASALNSGVGVAHLAHLAGLGVGLAYGLRLKRRGERAPQQLQIGGGRGGPGMGGGRGPF